ncbi:MAG: hypothetical protein IKJ08_01860 [Alistipes sp.]|nr:hypothetical protein [Alistipes sp.]
MKRILSGLTALLLVVVTSCEKEPVTEPVTEKIVGQWHCTPAEMDVDIYVEFCIDGSFNLYQKVGEGRHRHYTGTWNAMSDILSGIYADGSKWGSSYKVSFSEPDTMVLVSQNGSNETMTYTRETIPSDVKDGSIVVRSIFKSDILPVL